MARENRGKKKLSRTIVVGPFRMAFQSLLEPEETDNGPRYKVTALFPPDYDIRPIEDAMWEVFEDAFGTNEKDWPKGRNDILPSDKIYDAGTKTYAGFIKGWNALSMSSVQPPGIVDADLNEVMSKREVYSGRWAKAQVTITTYANKSSGVGVYLNHVQLLDHDEAFTGRGNAADAFTKYEVKDRKRRDDDDEDETEEDERPRGRRAGRDDESRSRRRGRDEEDDAEEKEDRRLRRREEAEDEEDERPSRARRSRAAAEDTDDDDRSNNRRGRRVKDEDWN